MSEAKGQPTGGIAPFGYKWQNGKLIFDQKEAPIRRLIYDLFLKHRRKKSVAKILNDLGYRTRRDARFYDTTVDRLIRDETAKGLRTPNGDIVIEPIISKEVWQRANTILEGKKPTRKTIHLFAGLAFCDCGGRMIVPSNAEKYVCIDCRHKIPCEDLDAIFQSRLSVFSKTSMSGLFFLWDSIIVKEKRTIVEQICERIVVGKTSIEIDFSFAENEKLKEASSPVQIVHMESIVDNPSIPFDEPLLSEKEAAEFLDVSVMTLRRRRRANQIEFVLEGLHPKYSKERHLRPYLAAKEKKI
jgi:hypothetical protein